MREEIVKYLYAVGITEILHKQQDLESALVALGYDMGKYLIISHKFTAEKNISVLLYKLVYLFLSSIYDTKRTLEKSASADNTYIITEYSPFFAQHVSLPKGCTIFTIDSIFSGVIKRVLAASGFDSDVTAHNTGTEEHPDAVSYVVVIKGDIK